MITKKEFLNQIKEQIYPLLDRKQEEKVFRFCMIGTTFTALALLCLTLFLNELYPAPDQESWNIRILGLIFGPVGIAVFVSAVIWKSYMRSIKKKLRPAVLKILDATYVSEKELKDLFVGDLKKMFFLPHFARRSVDTIRHDSFCLKNEKSPVCVQEVSFSAGLFHPEIYQGPLVRFPLQKKSDVILMVLKKEELPSRDRRILETQKTQDELTKVYGIKLLNLKSSEWQDYFVFTNDLVKAKRILASSFMKNIRELEAVYRAPVHFLFDTEQLILFIKTNQDMFEFFTESRILKSYEKFYDEIAVLDRFRQKF